MFLMNVNVNQSALQALERHSRSDVTVTGRNAQTFRDTWRDMRACPPMRVQSLRF